MLLSKFKQKKGNLNFEELVQYFVDKCLEILSALGIFGIFGNFVKFIICGIFYFQKTCLQFWKK